MKKALLLSFIFLALVLSSATAISGNNSTINITVTGDFDNFGEIGNTSEALVYFDLIQQPTQIKGEFNGTFTYVGFYPLQDNYIYYAPFNNGTFTYHCNPDSVDIGESIICTGTLIDENSSAVLLARINWEMYDYNGTMYDYGVFEEVGNGVYKFQVDLDPNLNLTTGDYYFLFTSDHSFKGGIDYSFPFFVNFEDKLVFILPAFIFAGILAYLSVNVNPIKSNKILQLLFLMGALFFGIIGFAIQLELANVSSIAASISAVPYQAMILMTISVIALIFLLIIMNTYKNMANVVPKWDRKEHKYK